MTAEHEDVLKLIGGRIRKLRSDWGDSLNIAYEIRAKYGVKLDPSYLSRIERGKMEIPLRTLMAVAAYFGVAAGELLDGERDDEPVGTSREEDEALFDECRGFEDRYGLPPCSMAGFLQNPGFTGDDFKSENLDALKRAREHIHQRLNVMQELRDEGNVLLERLHARLGVKFKEKDRV